MERVSLTIHNRAGFPRREEPVTTGVPLPMGAVRDSSCLVLTDANGERAAQFTPLCRWPDGSIKWVLVDLQATVAGNSVYTCFLETADTKKRQQLQGIQVEEQANALVVDTGATTFILDKQRLLPFTAVSSNKSSMLREGGSRIVLRDQENKSFFPEIEDVSVELSGALRATIKAEGTFKAENAWLLRFIARLHFFKNKSLTRIDFTLWNRGAARHAGGLWDLGDPGSVLFRELSFGFAPAEDRATAKRLRAEEESGFTDYADGEILLYQDSSGGENWKSSNHVNRNGEVPIRFRGYKVYQGETVTGEGLRATPILYVGDSSGGIAATIANFWQNFPKAIDAGKDGFSLYLFPSQFADLHELQGGEKKTHSIYLDFDGDPESLSFVHQPLICTFPREWYARTETVPYLSRSAVKGDQPYDELLASALTGEQSFFAKREIIDEYGWRNFGEVYADHEAVGHEGKTPLVSHYNNQYDQIYGFFREFIASSDGAWFQLMNELAHHVADIDIYHTCQDRSEYNNGLHWHTNHYLDAATCTHRSLSKAHLARYDARFYGGGPGLEHCYASGFMYHYFLTGEEASREALLALADWVINCISEPDTVLGLLYRIKSLLPQWKQALAGNKTRADRFPLTRGSGNPVSALLDTYALTSDKQYLRKAEEIVRGCIHPHDDIDSRDLLNAETGWSYNVCLQAIGKYLDVKISLNELDYMYAYAQESLLHYAEWMLEHEYPYLEKPDILEFPNETWPAQDLRKSCVFYFAAKHSLGDRKRRFLDKAEFFHNYVISKLNEFETRSLARPIALLMQNRWMHAYFSQYPDETAPICTGKYDFSSRSEFWSIKAMMQKIASGFVYALKKTSFEKERYWLRCRRGKHV